MTPTLADLFVSPDHYLHAFAGEEAVFVPMDPASYRASIFLDHRVRPAREGALRVPIDTLLAQPAAPLAANWIFHVAHCGSTLLARALESLGSGLVLREPLALRQVAVGQAGALLPLALAMAGKRYPGGSATIVKANVPVNFMLDDIAAVAAPAAVILLYHGWREYLSAVLRSADHRAWLRGVAGELAPSLGDLSGLSDAECAAALWAAQVTRFAAAAAMPQARALDADRFFAQPAEMLAAAARLFGIEAEPSAFAAVVAGPLFATYSKNPDAAFGNAERLARRARAEADLGAELAAAEDWLAHHGAAAEDAVRQLGMAGLGA